MIVDKYKKLKKRFKYRQTRLSYSFARRMSRQHNLTITINLRPIQLISGVLFTDDFVYKKQVVER